MCACNNADIKKIKKDNLFAFRSALINQRTWILDDKQLISHTPYSLHCMPLQKWKKNHYETTKL